MNDNTKNPHNPQNPQNPQPVQPTGVNPNNPNYTQQAPVVERKTNPLYFIIPLAIIIIAALAYFLFFKSDKKVEDTGSTQQSTQSIVQSEEGKQPETPTITTTTTQEAPKPTETKSNEKFENFKSYVSSQFAEDEIVWGDKTDLDNDGFRLNDFKIINKDDKSELTVETVDVLDFTKVEGGYNYEFKAKNILIDGKHPFMADDEAKKELAKAGISNLEPLEVYQKVVRDVGADKADFTGDFIQPGLMKINTSGVFHNVNNLYKELESDPSVAEDSTRMMALLVPVSIEKMDMTFKDEGALKLAGDSLGQYNAKTCSEMLVMFQVNLDNEQLCGPLSNFLTGANKEFHIEMNPNSPYQISKLLSVFQSPTPPDFKALFNEMGLNIHN
ncbi:hypothetical membrane protein [Taylorella asinigenitalis 14/45]|uniref:Hypothetical membrane protein n=1 Tax=Taylorella asinigenitalis 14/45 TaxID=1091495 RepID=I7JLS0_9BURK|nr:hypothetical protein [Taylorella asinigenitalis]CCG19163.1 hypothetical membrane protein [Taylorella asinigenitalis 14/45]